MLQVKNILCDLVDYAYDDNNPKRIYIKKFYIEVSEQNKIFHGDYDIKRIILEFLIHIEMMHLL